MVDRRSAAWSGLRQGRAERCAAPSGQLPYGREYYGRAVNRRRAPRGVPVVATPPFGGISSQRSSVAELLKPRYSLASTFGRAPLIRVRRVPFRRGASSSRVELRAGDRPAPGGGSVGTGRHRKFGRTVVDAATQWLQVRRVPLATSSADQHPRCSSRSSFRTTPDEVSGRVGARWTPWTRNVEPLHIVQPGPKAVQCVAVPVEQRPDYRRQCCRRTRKSRAGEWRKPETGSSVAQRRGVTSPGQRGKGQREVTKRVLPGIGQPVASASSGHAGSRLSRRRWTRTAVRRIWQITVPITTYQESARSRPGGGERPSQHGTPEGAQRHRVVASPRLYQCTAVVYQCMGQSRCAALSLPAVAGPFGWFIPSRGSRRARTAQNMRSCHPSALEGRRARPASGCLALAPELPTLPALGVRPPKLRRVMHAGCVAVAAAGSSGVIGATDRCRARCMAPTSSALFRRHDTVNRRLMPVAGYEYRPKATFGSLIDGICSSVRVPCRHRGLHRWLAATVRSSGFAIPRKAALGAARSLIYRRLDRREFPSSVV